MIVAAMTLTGCVNQTSTTASAQATSKSKVNETINADLRVPRFTNFKVSDANINLVVNDKRPYQHVLLVDDAINEQYTKKNSAVQVQQTFNDVLKGGFETQGFTVNKGGHNGVMTFDILEYNVSSNASDDIQSTVKIHLNFEDGKQENSFSKTFKGQAIYTPEYAPTKQDYVDVLNKNAQRVIDEIVNNKELQIYVRQNIEQQTIEKAL